MVLISSSIFFSDSSRVALHDLYFKIILICLILLLGEALHFFSSIFLFHSDWSDETTIIHHYDSIPMKENKAVKISAFLFKAAAVNDAKPVFLNVCLALEAENGFYYGAFTGNH